MDDIQKIIDSGILDLYVLNSVTSEEKIEVERLATAYTEIKDEIDLIRNSLEGLIETSIVAPSATVRPFIFAGIDFKERMMSGETPSLTPVLNENSKISDFKEWIIREDMQLPDNFKDYHIKILSYTPTMSCAIVWIENEAPYETHHEEYEKLLILEGSCEITYGDQVKEFFPGDFFEVPLHTDHRVLITSDIPCKVILQRIAIAA